MSIHFISGRPGGGKSFYALKLIVEELVHGDRVVITNLSINPGKLNAYLQDRFPARTVDLLRRLQIIPDERLGRFYLIRPGGYEVADCEDGRLDYSKCARGEDVKAAGDLGGVLYVLDEIHTYFNAREWMNTGKGCLFYLSQHRKLGDDVIAITQAVNNVDKQFRSVAQDFTYLRNLSKEKMGKFRLINRVLRLTYLNPPGSANEKPMEEALVKIDVGGLAECYNTASGVGIHGKHADKNERKTGLPLWVLGVGVVGLIVALAYVPHTLGKIFSKSFAVVATPNTNAVQALTGHKFPAVRATGTAGTELDDKPPAPRAAHAEASSAAVPAPERHLVGVTNFGGTRSAFFDTGEVFKEGDYNVQHVGADFAVIGWVVYRFEPKRAEAKEKSPAGFQPGTRMGVF